MVPPPRHITRDFGVRSQDVLLARRAPTPTAVAVPRYNAVFARQGARRQEILNADA
jgi:hypothetical protein